MYRDFDMNLAHPSLLLVNALRMCGKTNNMQTFPIFRKYRDNYKEWRQFLVVYGDMTKADAKQCLSKLMYGGRPVFDLPFLWALWAEMQAASRVLLDNEEFAYLSDMFGNRRYPEASRLFYAVSNYEDALLHQVISDYKDTFHTAKINALIYDGFIAIQNDADTEEEIKDALDTFAEQTGFKWSYQRL